MTKIVEFEDLRNKKYIFKNREHAARMLAESLKKYAEKNPIILAIPSGGVPVGKIISDELGAEFGLLITKKIQFLDDPEAGFGAVSFDHEVVLNEVFIATYGMSDDTVNAQVQRAKEEVEMRASYSMQINYRKLKEKMLFWWMMD